jgi:choline dehydrogenase-like flavoprotein
VLLASSEVPPGRTLRAAVAIVGAGPAGLTVAKEMARTGADVLVLESGGLDAEHAKETGRQPAPTGTYDLGRARFRGFGGSSRRWLRGGWRARPMDAIDFRARPGVPEAAWPFSRHALEPYFERAQAICGLGRFDYDYRSWLAREPRGEVVPLEAPGVRNVVFQIGPPDRFADMVDEVRRAERLRVVVRATVTRIERSAGGAVSRLAVRAANGKRFAVQAGAYVLAAGGIDNPRLLLASGGIGNERDRVGRCFQEHLHANSGVFVDAAGRSLAGLFHRPHVTPCGTKIQGGLGLTEALLEAEALQNTTLWLYPVPATHATAGLRSLAEIRQALRDRRLADRFGRHLRNLLRDRDALGAAVRGKLSGERAPKSCALVAVESEQRPNPSSRVVLSDALDAHGLPIPRLEWRITDEDRRSIRRTQELIGERLRAAGAGWIEEPLGDEDPPVHLGGGAHHMGTTRMHPNPAQGVVDADCRVHGCPNLFVAGSSVFPSSGSANPTLTLVALAVRLADRLKAERARVAA